MFEQEAEKYKKHFENELYLFDNTEIFPKDIEESYQKGAEHGYHSRDKEVSELENEIALLKAKNKGFENQILGLLIKYEEFYKRFPDLEDARKEVEKLLESTQWHYVKDGDLPSDRHGHVVINQDWDRVTIRKGRFEHLDGDKAHVTAWREIIFPTEN